MENPNLKTGENKVFFDSDGKKLAGLLYLPPDYQEGQQRPGIVVTRPASGVKEQTAGLYAKKLSEKGFVTLAFDPKGYGESEGRPQYEDPLSVISDTKNAITYIESLPQVDKINLFNAGICMGAGYATAAATEDDRIKATAGISPCIVEPEEVTRAFGGPFVFKAMNLLIFQPISFLLGLFGLNAYMSPVPTSNFMKRIIPKDSIAYGMREYYIKGKPGSVPNWKNKANLAGMGTILKYNPFDYPPKYKKKAFFWAYADGGYYVDKMQKFYDDIPAEDKDIFIGKNATHFDLYYKPEYVDPIVERVTNLFKKHIK